MATPTPGVVNFTSKFGATFGLSQTRVELLIPHAMAVRNAFRDSAYTIIDLPFLVRRVTSSYGYYRKYLRQMRKHGKANPEDFKDADMNELRMMVNDYYHTRGPVMKVDLRIFNWMYLIMGIIVLYEAYFIQKGMDAKIEGGGSSWDRRREEFDDEYEEDVRR